MRKIIEKSVDTVLVMWIMRFVTQQQDTPMKKFTDTFPGWLIACHVGIIALAIFTIIGL
jgi:hypothetical protein